jgi:hypothetical protein
LLITVNAGSLTITEDAKAGYELVDVYTVPADRLISKDISARSVTVTIVPGNASTQTLVFFVNRAVSSQVINSMASDTQTTDIRLNDNPMDSFMQFLADGLRGWLQPTRTTASTR